MINASNNSLNMQTLLTICSAMLSREKFNIIKDVNCMEDIPAFADRIKTFVGYCKAFNRIVGEEGGEVSIHNEEAIKLVEKVLASIENASVYN